MRNYFYLDRHLSELYSDVYEQPEDRGHTNNALRLCKWAKGYLDGVVLDVGCGNGFCQEFIPIYVGVGFGKDIQDGQRLGRNVLEMDYNFLTFDDESFDTVFSRHSLEHSPFPLLTLMEWHRVSKKYLVLCAPNPDHYTFTGRNHYSVGNASQMAWWLRRAGWKIKKARKTDTEYWFVATKEPRISYEGWAKAPLDGKLYEFERDIFDKSNLEIFR